MSLFLIKITYRAFAFLVISFARVSAKYKSENENARYGSLRNLCIIKIIRFDCFSRAQEPIIIYNMYISSTRATGECTVYSRLMSWVTV